MSRITIVGLGLIGTSLALALRESGLTGVEIVGSDTDREAAVRASRRQAIDRAEPHLPTAVEGANMVVVATPVMAIREVFETIAPHLVEGAVVTDTGSTKRDVLKWAGELLPASASFVGGHPMAGKTEAGPDAADPALFEGATYCILPSPKAEPEAVKAVSGLASAVKAEPYFLDLAEHDSYVAAVSHLPIALAAAVLNVTSRSAGWREMARLAAGGYDAATRLAETHPIMSRDIFLTNQQAITHWIDETIKELYAFRNILSDGAPDLEQRLQDFFYQAWEQRVDWKTGISQREAEGEEVPGATESLAHLLAGEWVTRRLELEETGDGRKGRTRQKGQRGRGWFRR